MEDDCDSDQGYSMWSVPYIDNFMKSGILANVLKTYNKRNTNVKSKVLIVGMGGWAPSFVFILSSSGVGVGERRGGPSFASISSSSGVGVGG